MLIGVLKYIDKVGKQFSLFDLFFELLRIFLGGFFVFSSVIKLFILTLLYGFSSLHYKNNFLSDPKLRCCELGGCNHNPPYNYAPCSTLANAYLKPNCEHNQSVTISCYECVDLIRQNRVCFNPPPSCCLLHDGFTLYCGGPNPLWIEK